MIFFLIATIILALIYSYIGLRLIVPTRLKAQQKWIAWTALLLLPLFLPLSFFLRINIDNALWGDISGWIAYANMGFFLLVFISLLARDVAWTIIAGVKKSIAIIHGFFIFRSRPIESFDPDRRHLMTLSMNLGIIGVSALLTGYGFYQARRQATIVNVSVPIPDLPNELEGFQIAQISDIHAGPTIKREYVQAIVEQTNKLKADVIAFTGDVADDHASRLRNDVAPLKELSAPYGTFFVTGNHEYYSGAHTWVEEMERLGFTVLLNEHRVLERDSASVILAGVTDYNAGRFFSSHASNPKTAISGAPHGNVKILLAHQPRSIFSAAKEGFDLQISGHTHGGQFIPWNFLVALNQPFIKGLHRYEKTWIYVNSGTGYWGPPLRLGIPSEITVINLTALKWKRDVS